MRRAVETSAIAEGFRVFYPLCLQSNRPPLMQTLGRRIAGVMARSLCLLKVKVICDVVALPVSGSAFFLVQTLADADIWYAVCNQSSCLQRQPSLSGGP